MVGTGRNGEPVARPAKGMDRWTMPCIAHVLSTPPFIVFVDGPAGKSVLPSGQEVIQLLRDCSNKSIPVLMVTHNPAHGRQCVICYSI